MTTVILGLVAGYVALAVLLLAAIVYSRIHWAAKVCVVVVISAFYPITYFSLMGILGWPTSQRLPDRFRLVSAQVYEPNKTRGTSGRIYLWVASLSKNAGQVTPRAFELPYSKNLHAKITEAKRGLQKGKQQMGEIEGTAPPASGLARILDFTQTAAAITDIDFFELSDTLLPEK